MMPVAALVFAAVAAVPSPAAEASADPRPVAIVVIAPADVQARLHDAVVSLLPAPDRFVWLDGGGEIPTGGPQIRVEILPEGEARVSVYPTAGPPVVRSLERGQPEAVAIETVAQIVRETAATLCAPPQPRAATAPVQPVGSVVAAAAASPPAPAARSAWALEVALTYVERSALDNSGTSSLPSSPSEAGLGGSVTMLVGPGRLRSLASVAMDFTRGQPIDGLALSTTAFSSYVLVGASWALHPVLHVTLAGGAGVERATFPSDGFQNTAWSKLARGMVGISIALPKIVPSFGLAVTAAVTVDVRESLHIEQSWLTQLGGAPVGGAPGIASYSGDTDRVVPGLAFGLAWRSTNR